MESQTAFRFCKDHSTDVALVKIIRENYNMNKNLLSDEDNNYVHTTLQEKQFWPLDRWEKSLLILQGLCDATYKRWKSHVPNTEIGGQKNKVDHLVVEWESRYNGMCEAVSAFMKVVGDMQEISNVTKEESRACGYIVPVGEEQSEDLPVLIFQVP
jgi:hypothetical protein